VKIDLTELLYQVGNVANVKIDVNEHEINVLGGGLNLTQPAKVALKLVNTGNLVIAEGSLSAEVKLECSRCLKDFSLPINLKIKEEFAKKAVLPKAKAGELELHENDFVAEIDKDNTFDLSDMVRQNLLLALPIKPLCDKNCQGLKG
jgi:uncharacterized protein